jgi:hypothetical protein
MQPSLENEFILSPPPFEPKMKMGRNEPCWCGSGKKWKKCHRDRHLQPEVPKSKLSNDLWHNQKNGTCLHPDAPSNCSRKIINAHTIQRAGGLSAIAENGHVISGIRGCLNIHKNNGEIVPESLGINNASTFMGFCETHDNELFEPIEGNGFTLNHEAAFLLSFRAISYEYLMKLNAIRAVEFHRERDRGKDFEAQVDHQQLLHFHREGLIKGTQDLELWKSEYDRMYIARDYVSMPHYAVKFDGILPFVSSGGFHPEVDFSGCQLQIITQRNVAMEHVCINVSVFGESSFLVLGWHGIPDGPAVKFVKSFKSIENKKKANSCLIMAVEQLENTHFNPVWWNSLNESDKRYLIKRIQPPISRMNSVRPPSTYQNLKQIIRSIPVSAEFSTL